MLQGRRLLIIADGAAFGSEMERVMQKVSVTDQIMLYLPESFEWLILKSGIVESQDIRDIINDPSQYIDSEKYMSWERYFTSLLVERTKDTYLHYSKNKLNDAYKNYKIQKRIISQIPEGIL